MATQFAVDLVFKSQGDQKIKQVTNQLRGLSGAGQQAAAGTTQAANGIRKTGRAAASATANVQRFGIAFRSVLGPLVAVTGAITFFGRSLKVLGERQADVAALENGLKGLTTNGNAALQSLLASADKLGKQTLFNDEDFRKSFKLLTSFRTIGVSTYERVGTVAADMAQVLGQDVSSVMLQVAKALEAPEVGLTALQRSGTRFTDQQKDQVKAMVEAGKTAEAQAYILAELERQYGGAAKAAGSAGFAGAMDSLGEVFRDFQETIGKVIEPLATGFVRALTLAIQWMDAGYQAVYKILKALSPLGEVLDAVGINWDNFGKAVDLAGRVVSVVANDVAYLVGQMAQTVANVLKGLFGGITQFFSGIVTSSGQGMKGVVQNVVNGVRAIRNAIASLINAAPPAMLSKFLGFDVGKTLTAPIGGVASGIEAAFNYGSSVVQRAQSLNFGAAGGFSDIQGSAAPGGGGGGKDGKGGKGGKAEDLALLQGSLEIKKKIFEIDQQIRDAELAGNEGLVLALEKKKVQLDLDQKILQARGDGLKVEEARLEAADKIAELDFKAAKVEAERKKTLEDLLTGFDREVELAEAKDDWARELLKIEHAIVDARKKGLLVSEEDIKKYRERAQAAAGAKGKGKGDKVQDYMKRLREEIGDTKGMVVDLGQTVVSELGSAMSSAVTGLIDGTKTAQEAFSDMFKNIGKAFIDMATQMIAKAIVLKVLGIAFGVDGMGMGNGRASGGPVLPGNTYLVGENGPEMLTMPSGSAGNISSASRTQSAMSRWQSGGSSAAASDMGDGAGGGSAAEQAPQINISGGVMQFGGDDYIRKDQLPGIINQAGKMGEARTLARLRNSPSTRQKVGLR